MASLPNIPSHLAIIMDGNGRWASRRRLPRIAGHKAGVNTVKTVVKLCAEKGIGVLTLFAFSSENWSRPEEEVGLLMNLFVAALQHEVREIHRRNVRIEVIGDRAAFSPELQRHIADAECLTAGNTGLELRIAANYGGRWDVVNAARRLAWRVERGELTAAEIDDDRFEKELSLAGLPDPDLFIRTGGESRVSNFLLWNLAYTELYFSDILWPDFGAAEFARSLTWYAGRQRRFGRTGEQVEAAETSLQTGRDGSGGRAAELPEQPGESPTATKARLSGGA